MEIANNTVPLFRHFHLQRHRSLLSHCRLFRSSMRKHHQHHLATRVRLKTLISNGFVASSLNPSRWEFSHEHQKIQRTERSRIRKSTVWDRVAGVTARKACPSDGCEHRYRLNSPLTGRNCRNNRTNQHNQNSAKQSESATASRLNRYPARLSLASPAHKWPPHPSRSEHHHRSRTSTAKRP